MIGERAKAAKAMNDGAEWLTLIASALPVALYSADVADDLVGPRTVSESLAASLGYGAADFIDRADLWMSRVHPSDLPELRARASAIAATGAFALEYRWLTADGGERIFLDRAVLAAGRPGCPPRIQGIALDVTDRAGQQHQQGQMQRMAAVGRITSNVAHELNNLLTVIMWNLDLMTRSLDGTSKDFDRAHIALSAALNGTGLLKQLLSFARAEGTETRDVEVGKVLNHVAQVLRLVVGADVSVEIKPAPGLWPIKTSPDQLELALVNLAIYARQTMPEGGSLVIEANNRPGRYRMTPGDSPETEAVVLAINAVASGPVTAAAAGRAADALAMVQGAVEASGGRLVLAPAGASPFARLIYARVVSGATSVETENSRIIQGHPACTVLVVEDDPDVRSITIARVGELGHNVLAAGNAQAALDILARDERIDLLFTDIAMPGGMNGLELARRALQLRPGIRILFVSGYTSASRHEGSAPGEFLQKPYRQEDLDRALSRALLRDATAVA
jgi:CheY-like chemotaxis protein/signal transduction histidine kinase